METKDFEFEISDPMNPLFIPEPYDDPFQEFNPTRVIKFVAGLIPVLKYNMNHDAKGQFATGDSMSSADAERVGFSLSNRQMKIVYTEAYNDGRALRESGVDVTSVVANRRAAFASALADLKTESDPRSLASESLADVVLDHYGFIHGATGARRVIHSPLFTSGILGGYTLSSVAFGKSDESVEKFNQNHDAATGEFSSGGISSGSPKLTVIGKNEGANKFFNEHTRVVRYQPEGKAPTDYVLVVEDMFGTSSVVAWKRPTDGTEIDGNPEGGFGNYKQKPVGRLEAVGAHGTAWRASSKNDTKGTVASLVVRTSHQRRGLASAMLKFHRDTYPELDIQHSHALTDEGRAFASVVKYNQNHDGKTGQFSSGESGGLPAEPGTVPIPAGDVRLFHQTIAVAAEKIATEGIRVASALGIEGPAGIYAAEMQGKGWDAKGFYSKIKDQPTVEFHVPQSSLDPFTKILFHDVPPSAIIAVHLPWHSTVRAMVTGGHIADVRAGKFDHVTEADQAGFPQAVRYVKSNLMLKFNPNHDNLGRFSSGTGMSSSIAESIIARTKANGGLSVRMISGKEPRGGFMVATSNAYSVIVPDSQFFDRRQGIKILADYAKAHRDKLVDGKYYLGLWHNGGQVYLDVSEHTMNQAKATEQGRVRNQKTIWDVTNFAEIDTGGTGVDVQKGRSDRDTGESFEDDGRGDRRLGDGSLRRFSGNERVIKFEAGLTPVLKYNQNHDAKGQFSSAEGTLYFIQPGETMRWDDSAFESAYRNYNLSDAERQHLASYQDAAYFRVNTVLRKGADGTEALVKAITNDLDSAIARAPVVKSDSPIYRVFSVNAMKGLEVGKVFEDKGFMSATLHDLSNPKLATVRTMFGELKRSTSDVVARIYPNGHHSGLHVNAANFRSQFASEREFLLPRGSQLKYLGSEKTPGGETVMNFERVNDGSIPVTKYNHSHDKLGHFASGSMAQDDLFSEAYIKAGLNPADPLTHSLPFDESMALKAYLLNGYIPLNSYLRTGISKQSSGVDVVPTGEAKTYIDHEVASLDHAIALAPQVKSDTPIYRVFSTGALGALEVGKVYEDKGFMSTSLKDLSHSDNGMVRTSLGALSKSPDVVARIYPNGYYSGLSVTHVVANHTFETEAEFILPRGIKLRYLGQEQATSVGIYSPVRTMPPVNAFERMN